MNKTEYRTENDGHWDYLQYKVIKKNFWGKKYERWEYILDAKFDVLGNLMDYFEWNRLINSGNYNLKEWVKQFPDINMWIEKRNKMIEEQTSKKEAREKQKQENKGKIKYL